MVFLHSTHPKLTEVVAWPHGTFKFEGLTVALHGFERAAHSDDHAIWYLVDEKVAHLAAVAKRATEIMRPKYGAYYGFEAGTPSNAQMVEASMFSYR